MEPWEVAEEILLYVQRSCRRASRRTWRAANRDKVCAGARALWAANPDKARAKARAWRVANPDKVRAYKMGEPPRLLTLLNAARGRAKRKQMPCTVTLDWLKVTLKRQNGKCCMCGTPFSYTPPENTTRNPAAPSLDQIRPKRGYTVENTAVVCVACNIGKHEMELDAYIEHCRRVADFNQDRQLD